MDLDALLESLGLTEADLDAISQAGIYDESAGLLQQQQALAQQMRGTPAPEGRQVGGTFQAAHPLEFAATALARIKGDKQSSDVLAQQKALIEALRQGQKTGGAFAAIERMGGMPMGGLKPSPY